ncbi:MAG: amino acid--tRNA ligase-related protein [Candidatus Paceibacterota bacterium]
MTRITTDKLHNHIDETITLKGWVANRRDHGKLMFVDLADRGGSVQMVILPNHEDAQEAAQDIRSEWVIQVEGKVNKRPEKMVNEDEENGDIEIEVLSLNVLNESKTPPYEIREDNKGVDENVRLKYRYLDLRNQRMQHNLRTRSEFVQKCREFLFGNNFTEIETPLLTKTTPEGSRDFVVPSRMYPGKFYALPQSPQQYKQLLMTAGFERYFQISRAVRDEDLRADRGFEHTQLDLEISFVEREDVLNLVEEMITAVVEKMGYTIKEKPFPRISYADAMEKHGADKFDLRTEAEKEAGNVLAYAWVVDFPMFERVSDEESTGMEKGEWTFSHNPFSAPMPDSLDDLLAGENIENIIAAQYDLVCNGFESGGGSVRSHKREWLEATYKIMGYSEEEMEESVGHMLESFDYGTPPHGGIALGVERNIMNLTGEESLREVQAFPQTRRGKTSVMDAPTELSEEQLNELGIKIEKE